MARNPHWLVEVLTDGQARTEQHSRGPGVGAPHVRNREFINHHDPGGLFVTTGEQFHLHPDGARGHRDLFAMMDKSGINHLAGPARSFATRHKICRADGVVGGVEKLNRQPHFAPGLPPILVNSLQLVAKAHRLIRRAWARAESEFQPLRL
jgi:hypothetical protein